jgi:hypothetical protein
VTLAAPLQPVPAGAGTFEIGLKVDPKAAAATATLKLTTSTTIAGMAYALPPVSVPLRLTAAK